MAVTYTQTLSTDMVVTEIESLLDWRNHILREGFFPGSERRSSEDQAPSTLLMWCRKSAETGIVDPKIVERMSLVYDELCKSAQDFSAHCKSGQKPTIELYDAFEMRFESFITQIRRLQQDISNAGMSVDPVTGLRTVAGMRGELKREQDRFDRKGTSFSVASVGVDHIRDIEVKYDRRGQEAIFAGVAHILAKGIRSFDDAYYMGQGEYVIVVKHLDFMDACAVMDRLRADIEKTFIMVPGGEKIKLTASFGVSEALQRERADIALDHAKAALHLAKEAGGNCVREYLEKSALERFAKDVKK